MPEPTDPSAEPTEDGNACPYEIFAYDLPSGIKKPNKQGCTVTEEHYATHRYNADGNPGEEVEATLYVYTPYGYDSSKEYNIIYLMHGAGETVGFWLGPDEYAEGGERYNRTQADTAVRIVNNLIASGDCEEVILVAATPFTSLGLMMTSTRRDPPRSCWHSPMSSRTILFLAWNPDTASSQGHE